MIEKLSRSYLLTIGFAFAGLTGTVSTIQVEAPAWAIGVQLVVWAAGMGVLRHLEHRLIATRRELAITIEEYNASLRRVSTLADVARREAWN